MSSRLGVYMCRSPEDEKLKVSVGSRVLKALATATPSTPPQATKYISPGALHCYCLCLLGNNVVLRASDERMDITGGSSGSQQRSPWCLLIVHRRVYT